MGGELDNTLKTVTDSITQITEQLVDVTAKKMSLLNEIREVKKLERRLRKILQIETEKRNAILNREKFSCSFDDIKLQECDFMLHKNFVSRTDEIDYNSDVKLEQHDLDANRYRSSSTAREENEMTHITNLPSGYLLEDNSAGVLVLETSEIAVDDSNIYHTSQQFGTHREILCHDKKTKKRIRVVKTARKRKKESLACLQCDAKVTAGYGLKRHNPCMHNNPKVEVNQVVKYDCPEEGCDRTFRLAYRLELHRQYDHLGVKPHSCMDCSKRFMTAGRLDVHKEKLHGKSREKLCSVCGKNVADYAALKNHMLCHSRQHSCSVCNKRFGHRCDLKNHFRRCHTSERPYTCAVCGKSFADSSGLAAHRPHHDTVKAHVCSVCDRSFHLAANLREHMRIHTGEKSHRCSMCGDKFMNRYQLNIHLTSQHDIDKMKYGCDVCGKKFMAPASLEAHHRSHSEERPHKCDHCEKSYKMLHDLRAHKKKQHGNTKD